MCAWRTSDFEGRDQFSYRKEVICEVFAALDPRAQGARHDFPSEVVSRDFLDQRVTDGAIDTTASEALP
jgi:hypothetical protein